jgi:hypothetical protein
MKLTYTEDSETRCVDGRIILKRILVNLTKCELSET